MSELDQLRQEAEQLKNQIRVSLLLVFHPYICFMSVFVCLGFFIIIFELIGK